jgi:phage-related protein
VKFAIGTDIRTVQEMWPLGKPLVDSFGKGLYEVRTTFDRCEYRVFFSILGNDMRLLHGYQKHSQKTPKGEQELARTRLKEDLK